MDVPTFPRPPPLLVTSHSSLFGDILCLANAPLLTAALAVIEGLTTHRSAHFTLKFVSVKFGTLRFLLQQRRRSYSKVQLLVVTFNVDPFLAAWEVLRYGRLLVAKALLCGPQLAQESRL